jgi:RecA/RadA recombinase
MAKGLSSKVSENIKGTKGVFDLDKFKKGKNLSSSSVKFKDQEWIPFSQAMQDVLQIPGAPKGHITILRGHSDTGKTTALLELAVAAQKRGELPVFIITEMKWSWEHARKMGLEFNEVPDPETGEVVDYNGNFIYVDREKLNCIEDVSAFIVDLLDEQKRGNLPYDLVFFWDSVGSVPARMSIEKQSFNNEWAAGAYSQQFGNFVNQRITLSRKESQPYTNTLIVVNKVWVSKPETIMSQPKLNNKGGTTFFFDSSIIITFGNVASSGTNKLKASKNGKDIEFAKRTKVSCDKNHITGTTGVGKIIMTPHGFIEDGNDKVLNAYKKEHAQEWMLALGSTDFEIVEEAEDKVIFDTTDEL